MDEATRNRIEQALRLLYAGIDEMAILILVAVLAMPRSAPRLTGIIVLMLIASGVALAYPLEDADEGTGGEATAA